MCLHLNTFCFLSTCHKLQDKSKSLLLHFLNYAVGAVNLINFYFPFFVIKTDLCTKWLKSYLVTLSTNRTLFVPASVWTFYYEVQSIHFEMRMKIRFSSDDSFIQVLFMCALAHKCVCLYVYEAVCGCACVGVCVRVCEWVKRFVHAA